LIVATDVEQHPTRTILVGSASFSNSIRPNGLKFIAATANWPASIITLSGLEICVCPQLWGHVGNCAMAQVWDTGQSASHPARRRGNSYATPTTINSALIRVAFVEDDVDFQLVLRNTIDDAPT